MKIFAAIHNTTGQKIFLIEGQEGFNVAETPQQLALWQSLYQVQPEAVTRAAVNGSMFGWDVPAAQPAIGYGEVHH